MPRRAEVGSHRAWQDWTEEADRQRRLPIPNYADLVCGSVTGLPSRILADQNAPHFTHEYHATIQLLPSNGSVWVRQ
jgi:hypothetical protein